MRLHCPALPNDWVLDGELLLPREYGFQTTCSAVKKAQELSVMLTYVVFDRYDRGHTKQPFWARYDNLSNWYPGLVDPIKMKVVLSSTYRADAPEAVEHWHGIWSCAGYEGVIVRDAVAPYVEGSAGRALQKYKKFLDEEFPIVDIAEATGKDAGTAIFVCETKAGERFQVRPKGSAELRRKYWEERESLVGKMLTVQYQEKFKSGTPQFPIGVAVRDYE
jgi:DNA ligase-1